MYGFCPWCDEEKELTEEHVIPDNIGGTITIQICNECNGILNRTFEQDATCNPMFAMARLTYGISGRRGAPRNPLAGVGQTDDGRRIRLDEGMVPFLLPTLRVEDTDRGAKLTLSIDNSDMDKADRIARREIERVILQEYPGIDEDALEAKIEDAMGTIEVNENATTGDRITRKLSVDFRPIQLLAMKIAYEMAYLVHGREYIESSEVGRHLRAKILARDCTGMVGQLNEPILNTIVSGPSEHSVAIVEDKCIVSLFGFVFLVRVSDIEYYRVPFHEAELVSISLETGEERRTSLLSEVTSIAMNRAHAHQSPDAEQ